MFLAKNLHTNFGQIHNKYKGKVMEEIKFTYVIEPTHHGGYIWVFEGKDESGKGLLSFYNETDLIEALKTYRKSSVFLLDDTPNLMKEGERLAKKLDLLLQHP